MTEITFQQLFIFTAIIWIITRSAAAMITKTFSAKREFRLLLLLVCIVFVFRFVYFGFHSVNGRIPALKIGFGEDIHKMVNIIPLYFITDRYKGWQMNIIGNIAMFIPVGILLPVCFERLDKFGKAVLSAAVFSLFIEVTQLVCIGRHTDIDDLILNTAGGAIGACIVFLIRRKRKKSLQQKKSDTSEPTN